MVVYNFKRIAVVPPAKDLIDIVLTRTQRKTPTEVHAGFQISRIRSFYMRKVRFTQDTVHEKLAGIVEAFPRLDVRRRTLCGAQQLCFARGARPSCVRGLLVRVGVPWLTRHGVQDIHPFYADLINVLYDRDHYKLALGHVSTAMHIVDQVGKDYLRMLKFGACLHACVASRG